MDTAQSLPSVPQQGFFVRLVGNPWAWAAFFTLAVVLHVGRAVMVQLPKPLPVLSHVGDFALTNQHNEPFGSPQLKGRVWVANFIFTRCPTVCPLSTQRMQTVMHRSRGMGDAFHLVSFSVDPEHDSPRVLDEFSRKFRVSPRMWSFLTGQREEILRTLVEGLKVQMSREGPVDDLMSLGHDNHFVLVDERMQVRGYYDASETAGIDALVRDAGLLANRLH